MPGSVSQALECNAVCPAQKLLEPPPEAAINYFSICILRLQPWRVRGSPPGWGSLIQGRPPEERVPLSSLQIAWLPALIPCSPGQGPGGGEVDRVGQHGSARRAKRDTQMGNRGTQRWPTQFGGKGRDVEREEEPYSKETVGGWGSDRRPEVYEWSRLPLCVPPASPGFVYSV